MAHRQQEQQDSDVTYAGWVFKEGSLIKSWKKRFLVVKYAELAYYKNTDQENKAQLLGAMTVARIEKIPDITNGLLLTSDEGRQLKIFTDSQRECDKCFHAIAQYARKQRGGSSSAMVPLGGTHGSDAIKRVGWLEKEGQHFKTWKKRYFVLEENVLSYSSQIGGTSLGKSRVLAARRDLTRPNTLVVMLDGGRELKIGGKTEAEIHDWHKALRRGIMKYGGHRSPAGQQSPAGLPSPAGLRSPAARQSPAQQSRSHMPQPPRSEQYAQPPPAYMEHVASARATARRDDQDHSPLFGSLPDQSLAAANEPPLTPSFSAEQERNMAARQNRDLAASFRRHIILDATPENGASFIEVEPEKDAVKPWSPKAPGANTIMNMRLEDKLLLEELEEERQEALLKEKKMLGDGAPQKDELRGGPCCCIVM